MKRLIGPLAAAILVLSSLPLLPSQADAQATATCMGRLVTIDMRSGASGIGTNGDDVILGTGKGDVIDGRGGNDFICSGNGNDRVSGGNGADVVRGGNDKDRLYGGPGNDELYGGNGYDIVEGEAGNDTLRGDDDDDVLDGGEGNDDLAGGDGDDLLRAGPGADTLRGGNGDDVLNGDDGNDESIGGAGADTLRGGNDDDVLRSGDGDDTLRGGAGDDELSGGDGDDELKGGSGDDDLNGGNDTDTCLGGGNGTTKRCEITDEEPPASGRFETLPVGAALPSGAECAARVRPAAEIRPENAAPNANRGSRANANNRTDWSQFDRVDGDFAGTTDEIIQWAACKWGIDEDIVRAQVIKESYWYMSANGDAGQSWGLGQVRDTAHQSAFEFSLNARNSSAYNLDYTYATWRACYEGVYGWLNNVEHNGVYGPGDVWGCLGVWFSGRWYVNNDDYLNKPGDSVRFHYENRTWETAGFINAN